MNRSFMTLPATALAGLSLLSITLFPASLRAQTNMALEECDQLNSQFFGNCSFERWSGGVPDTWEGGLGVTQSSDFDPNDAIDGDAYSARLEVLSSQCCPTMRSFQSGGGHRVDKAYPYFRGSFRHSLLMMDSLSVFLTVINRLTGATEGTGFARFRTEQPLTWEQFAVPINYSSLQPGEAADLLVEAQIGISGSPPFGDQTVGSWVLVDNVFVSSSTATGIDETGQDPRLLHVHQNFPNPTVSTTTIAFDLYAPSPAEVVVTDILGREVLVVVAGQLAAGSRQIEIDTGGLPSGVYFYRVQAGSLMETKRLVVAR